MKIIEGDFMCKILILVLEVGVEHYFTCGFKNYKFRILTPRIQQRITPHIIHSNSDQWSLGR